MASRRHHHYDVDEEVDELYHDFSALDIGDDDTHKRSSYTPEISPAAIKSIIRSAMAEEGVRKGEIPEEGSFTLPNHTKKSKRYFEVKGFAWFICPKKHHRWPSAQSWCFIDLKKQEICYRDIQKCKKCESKAPPEFTQEAIEKMTTYVVKMYLIKTRRLEPVFHHTSTDTEEIQGGGPHDEERCGRCRRLGQSCWK